MRRREPRPAAGPAELEALDPLTGESLSGAVATSSPGGGGHAFDAAGRARRLRGVRSVLAVLAVACAGTAAYFGVTISQLRSVERTWRAAIAVDRARATADTRVLETLAEVAGDDEDAAAAPLARIGAEAARRLEAAERTLAERRILDSKVSALRDEMVEALRFRRFQLTPQRAQMGSTPLQKVDAAIDVQLDRWGLMPSQPAVPTLRSVDGVLEGLRRFTDEPTGATLFAVTSDGVLITIDVDRSLARGRQLGIQPRARLLPAPGGVAVWDGAHVTVYPADVDDPPAVQVPASRGVFEVADGTGDLWIVEAPTPGSTVLRRFRPAAGESLQAPIPIPAERRVLGGAAGRLVLEHQSAGGLELWTPPTASSPAASAVLTALRVRFIAGDERRVLWQGPLPFGPPDSDGYLHLLDIQSARRELMALPPTDAATGDVAPDGTVAIAAGPLAGRLGAVLVARAGTAALAGIDGPRAALRPDTLRWSDDGSRLFWLTPDGRVAFRQGTARDAPSATMRTGLEGLELLTVMGR